MADFKILGDVTYPETGTRWVDKTDASRGLAIEAVEPGNRLGREIRGTCWAEGAPGRNYATDLRTFEAVWTSS